MSIERDSTGKPSRLYLSAGKKRVPSKEAEALFEAIYKIIFGDTNRPWSRDTALAAIDAALEAAKDREAEACAVLHESVDGTCDHERNSNLPGAGAFGAVIEYRDIIRARIAARQRGATP